MSITQAVDRPINYDAVPDDVDSNIGQARLRRHDDRGGPFSPQSNIDDARQRWLFRMVHSDRPLQEKMTLFWHNHFATGYTKIAGHARRDRRRRATWRRRRREDPGGVRGQIEMLRDNALGNFRDILLDDRARTRRCSSGSTAAPTRRPSPQENFGREIMELFTMRRRPLHRARRVRGGARLHRLEPDAARRRGRRLASTTSSSTTPASTKPTAKTFSFPIYADGSKTIPARSAADGMQDGLDLINALAAQPEHRALPRDQAVSVLRDRVRRRRRELRRPRRRASICRAATT